MNATTRTRVQPCPRCGLSSTDPGELFSRDGRSHTSPGVVVDPSGSWACTRCGFVGDRDDLAQLGARAIKLEVDPNRPPDLIPEDAAEVWAGAHPLSYVDPGVWGFLNELDVDPLAVPPELAAWLGPWAWLPPSYVTPRGSSWVHAGVRLVMPAYDGRGVMRHLLGLRLDPRNPVAILPAGASSAGLWVACGRAQRVLAGDLEPGPVELLLAVSPLAMLKALGAEGDGERLPMLAPVAPSALSPQALADSLNSTLARRFGAGRVQVVAVVSDALEAA